MRPLGPSKHFYFLKILACYGTFTEILKVNREQNAPENPLAGMLV
jgi:hypothetical protein